MTDAQLNRRLTLSNGADFNGIELWRALFVENIGGSIEMSNNERQYFISFPQCQKHEELQAHLGQWVLLRTKYGGALPEEHVKGMFHNILPPHVLDEVRKQRDLITLQQQIS